MKLPFKVFYGPPVVNRVIESLFHIIVHIIAAWRAAQIHSASAVFSVLVVVDRRDVKKIV